MHLRDHNLKDGIKIFTALGNDPYASRACFGNACVMYTSTRVPGGESRVKTGGRFG